MTSELELGGHKFLLIQDVLLGKWSGEMVVDHLNPPSTARYATSSKVEIVNGEIAWRFETIEKEGFATITNLSFQPVSDGKMRHTKPEKDFVQYLEEHPNSNTILIYSFVGSTLVSLETITLRENLTRVRVLQNFSDHSISHLTRIVEKNVVVFSSSS